MYDCILKFLYCVSLIVLANILNYLQKLQFSLSMNKGNEGCLSVFSQLFCELVMIILNIRQINRIWFESIINNSKST